MYLGVKVNLVGKRNLVFFCFFFSFSWQWVVGENGVLKPKRVNPSVYQPPSLKGRSKPLSFCRWWVCGLWFILPFNSFPLLPRFAAVFILLALWCRWRERETCMWQMDSNKTLRSVSVHASCDVHASICLKKTLKKKSVCVCEKQIRVGQLWVWV